MYQAETAAVSHGVATDTEDFFFFLKNKKFTHLTLFQHPTRNDDARNSADRLA